MSELAQLKDRIAQLEELIGIDRSLTGQLREAFGLEPNQAEILGMLYRRQFVTRDGLYTVLYGDRPEEEWPEDKVLDSQVSKLRKALRAAAKRRREQPVEFITKWGEGWQMSPATKACISKAIETPYALQAAC
jgi:DNA-binding response OmpR family regulator